MAQRRAQPVAVGTPAAESVFTTVLTQGPLSRVAIARRTNLSAASVTKAIRLLVEAGYLVERTERPDRRMIGRPANPVAVVTDREFFVGVKITAGDLFGVITDLRAGVRAARHLPLRSRAVPDVVEEIGQLVRLLVSTSPDFHDRTERIAVSLAGDVERRAGYVRFSPFLDWRDVPLAQLAQSETGRQAVVENDVRALTVAEHWFGAGVGVTSFALVTVGTGIGCGLVLGGALVSGTHGVAGELGHLLAESDGPPCRCGANGCVDAIGADPAILAQIRAATGKPRLSLPAAIALARSGDAAARRVYARAGRAIGLALASVANMLGPELIVISGEGLAAYDLFEDEIRRTFAARAFGSAAQCELIVRPLPFEEWARGAAAVAIQELITSYTKSQ